MRRLDIAGERYGNLVAIERLPTTSNGSRWVFKCDCGNRTEALLSNVRCGAVKSCGCLGSRNTIGQRSLKHGHGIGFKKSRTATAWRNAKTRCFNRKNEKYSDYGGRGITMCEEWSNDFRTFLRDMGECPDGLTLERDDVNGNYEPGNCRWATPKEQVNNRRKTLRVEGHPLVDFAAKTGIAYKRIHYRMKRHGETAQQAVEWFKRRRSSQSNKRSQSHSEKRRYGP